ncbi:OmpP1/FadL family transporter [Mucilaginibacter ginkgonis]|uniref:Outer membrane protein transport protein n=1 Tax=Mucilaginibacter ginkgonis TaxID=2682091 RepID=A0A6I4I3U2_9SPHI|nr:outer membrane protein transport protein [Mucilaginibacter ginkgonis]QQL49099.1 outer membrane protein transport protein [Mucilaginibacter ginkgonis]
MRKILLVLIIFFPALAFSQGFQVNLAGQKQIGMGHTGTGTALDGAAIFFNPGAVATLSQNYLQLGVSPVIFKSAFNPDNTNDNYHTGNNLAMPFSGYAAWGPEEAPWKVGLGVYTPYGGLTDWGQSWEGKYILEKMNLQSIYIQPTVSYRIDDMISIGAGFVYNRGSVDLTRAIPLANMAGADGQAELKGNGSGYGYNVGIYLIPDKKVSVGLNYRSKVDTRINSGNAIFTVPASVQSSFPQPNSFSSALPLPATASVGVGFYPKSAMTFAFDINYVQWSTYKSLPFTYTQTSDVVVNTSSPKNYRDAISIRGGFQYREKDKEGGKLYYDPWAYRFGAGYATYAARTGYVSPEVPDGNRAFVTGGIGYTFMDQWDLDFSFEYEHIFERRQTNLETALSGAYKTDIFIPGISITYHW